MMATNGAGVEVRLEDLRRSYAGVTALDGLSLTMAPGELVALLGPSGCGKTTAMRLVAGLEEANSGRVMFGGKDVTGLPANKRDVGMVFQAYSLFPHMTAQQNVEFGLSLHKVNAAKRRERSGEMLELVGLSKYANRYAHQLSGGQQDAPPGPAIARVRPEAVSLASEGDSVPGPLIGTVIAVAFLGATSRVTVDLGDIVVLAQLPTAEASAHPAGTRVRLAIRPDPVLIAREVEKAPGEA